MQDSDRLRNLQQRYASLAAGFERGDFASDKASGWTVETLRGRLAGCEAHMQRIETRLSDLREVRNAPMLNLDEVCGRRNERCTGCDKRNSMTRFQLVVMADRRALRGHGRCAGVDSPETGATTC